MADWKRIKQRLNKTTQARMVSDLIGRARERYPLDRITVQDKEALEQVLADFSHSLHRAWYRLPEDAPLPPDLGLDQALRFLGVPNVEPVLYAAMHGTAHGLRWLVDRIAYGFEKACRMHYIEMVLREEVQDPLDYEEISGLVADCLMEVRNSFADVSPVMLKNPAILCAQWRDFLLWYATEWQDGSPRRE